jgi:muconate cycloisomerase
LSQIESIETIPIALRPRRVAVMRAQAAMNTERVLVHVRTDDGVDGWGEATAIPIWGGMRARYFGETVGTVTHVIHDVLAPTLLGRNPSTPAPLMARCDELIVGHPYAKAALEMALQDIRGKLLETPVYELLGGPWRTTLSIAHMLGVMSDQEALAEAEIAVEEDGVAAFQVKGGEDADRDARLIALLRDRLPAGTFLRLDANQGYGHQPKGAANAVRKVAAAGVDAIEQPGSSIEALSACTHAVSVPIIADEGCWQPVDVLDLWRREAIDAISVYVAKAGGMTHASHVAATAAEVGLSCDVNGSLETGIGTAASLHVAAAAMNATLSSVVPVPVGLTRVAGRYFEDEVISGGLTYADGALTLSGRPGLGIDVDVERAHELAVAGGRESSMVAGS